jgi:electron transfer flavoprotein beta subunit
LKIIIPIKQVPETNDIRMDASTGTMVREGVESIVNPLDLYAIETGIQLKEKYGGSITAISMGPVSAEKALREAISMGCDDGILITGKEFAGSDTWTTSYTLSKAIGKIGDFDLILTGERATDGDTGQVGPGIASFLGITLATYVSRINEILDGFITVDRLVEGGYETLKMSMPSLLTVVKEISYPRLPTLKGKKAARRAGIIRWSAADLQLDTAHTGLKGSPTRVVKIDHPKVAHKGTIIRIEEGEGPEEAVRQLLTFLRSKDLV